MKWHAKVAVALLVIVFTIVYLFDNVGRHLSVYPNYSNKDPIQKRLAESEENWLRGLERRNLSLSIFRTRLAWKAAYFFWDFFYPSFDCPHTVERIGKIGEGGKWICGFEHLNTNCKKSSVVVYSYGISDEVSFEEEILQRTNFSVYMFDHTIDIVHNYARLKQKYPGRVYLEKIGLAAEKDSNVLRTLPSQMEINGHEFVDILKVDIEWAEWEVIEGFQNLFPSGVLPFGQLVMEIHLPKDPRQDVRRNMEAMNILEEMHLRPFKMEFNLGSLMNPPQLPLFCEYSFISTHVKNCLLQS